MNPVALSRLLGCLGLGLGAIEVAGPNCVSARLGLPRRPETMGWFGLRTIAAGLTMLLRPRAASGATFQALGGTVDMLMLLPALSERNSRRENARSAFMLLAGLTALDAACAAALVARPRPKPVLKAPVPNPRLAAPAAAPRPNRR